MKAGQQRRQVASSVSAVTYLRLLTYAETHDCTTASVVRQAIEQYLIQAEQPIVSPGRSWELDDPGVLPSTERS